jgi:hypothetical protein
LTLNSGAFPLKIYRIVIITKVHRSKTKQLLQKYS